MEQPRYDIYFSGQLVEGTDLETAKSSFANMFKASAETVNRFFSGKPQILKRGVDKAEALKYKAALHKAGLLVAFKAHQTQQEQPSEQNNLAPAPSSSAANEEITNNKQETNDKATDDWSLAPCGSDLLKESERHVTPPREVDTSAIKLMSAFAELQPEPKQTPAPPNTSHISVAPVGEDLLKEKPLAPPPLPLDLDNITLAPPGSDLEELKQESVPINPDISGISLAEAGADLLEGQIKQPPPPAPNTDHIKIAEN